MAVDADNVALPVDNALSSPASEGAAEFRALKTKINQLFLNTGVAATFPGLIDTNNKGINAAISDGSNIILYSSKFKVTRTASQPKDTLGCQSESVIAASVLVPANIVTAFTAITTINTGATHGGAYSLNSLIQQQNHAGSGFCIGFYAVFADRTSVGIAAPGGLGNNKYNLNSIAIMLDSLGRSSAGEYCGWKTGIKFQPSSMDRDFNGGGYCIDMSGLVRAITADPRTTYQCKGGIRLGNMLSVVYDDNEDVMSYFDPANNSWTLRYQNSIFFRIDVTTGAIYRNGVALP
jgi:hypothetical protein